MTFEDLTCDLPNGLHDAELLSVNHDLLNRTVILDMDVWIGTMADPPERRERYRRAELTLNGVSFWSVGPPREKSNLLGTGELVILSFQSPSSALSPELAQHLSNDSRSYTLFTGYIEIDFATSDARFRWTADETNRSN